MVGVFHYLNIFRFSWLCENWPIHYRRRGRVCVEAIMSHSASNSLVTSGKCERLRAKPSNLKQTPISRSVSKKIEDTHTIKYWLKMQRSLYAESSVVDRSISRNHNSKTRSSFFDQQRKCQIPNHIFNNKP